MSSTANPSLSFADSPVGPAASPAGPRANSRGKLWTGRALTGLVALFLLFDAVGKLVMPPPVVEATGRLGFPVSLIPGVGVLLLVCTLLYLIPRTAILGTVLVTGFFAGAVAIQMRASSPLFEMLFPVIFGILAWSGILLRERRLLDLFPLRSFCGR